MRLLVTLSVAVLSLTASPLCAQHLGARVQWQPAIADTDARLQQRVHIEIIGRAAVPALELLSDATGVALTVAPENLDTVGERKLTLISKGLTLKAIIVQLPEALQECHWDIDTTGEEPVYVLHRNGGAAYTREYAEGAAARREIERRRRAREERLGAARRALSMSKAELAQLEETDLLLARAAQHAEFRKSMEGLLSLPDDQMEQFLDTGHAQLDYPESPPAVQEAAVLFGAALNEEDFGYFGGSGITLDTRREAAQHPERWRIWYASAGNDGVLLTIGVPIGGHYGPIQTLALPPVRTCCTSSGEHRGRLHRLLVETGMPEAHAKEVLRTQAREVLEREADEEAAKRQREWREPSELWLREIVSFPGDRPLYWTEVLRLVSATGVSVVSDHFTMPWRTPPAEVTEVAPLWRALYLICDQRGYSWQAAGRCLTFRARRWWSLALREVPDSVIQQYRGRLERQGTLTLDDFVGMADDLADRPARRFNFPHDFRVSGLPRSRWALCLYRILSPEDRSRACSAEGLRFADMGPAHRRLIQERVRSIDPPVSEGAISDATFRIEEKTTHNNGWARHGFSFRLDLGERRDVSGLRYAVPIADTEAESPSA